MNRVYVEEFKIRRSFQDPVLYSNFLFILNAVVWLCAGHSVAALVVLITGLASFGYHLPKESFKLTHDIDVCCANVALVYTLYVAYPYVTIFEAIMLFAVLGIGLLVKRKAHRGNYDFWHTWWHVSVFVGQALLACIAWVNI